MTDAYTMADGFEREVVSLLVRSGPFYQRFVEYMSDAAFPTDEARTVLKAARLVFRDTQRGPGGVGAVEQQLLELHQSGKLGIADLCAANDYLAALPTDVDEATTSTLFARLLKRVHGARVVEKSIMAFANAGSLTDIATELQEVEAIGDVDLSVGDDLTTLQADLQAASMVERLSTGCVDLDAVIGGGVARREMAFFLAPSKTGKSLALVSQSIIAVRAGLNTLAITLELPSSMWRARHLAGLTGTPTNDVVSNPRSVAFSRLAQLLSLTTAAGRPLGKFRCHKMPAGVTQLAHVLAFVARVERYWGEPVDVLIIDYMDKMVGQDRKMAKHDQMLEVYEGGRLWAEDKGGPGRWIYTASQAKAHVLPGQMPAMNDCADAVNKVRVTDAMFGIQKHLGLPGDEDLGANVGDVSIQLLAARNYPETDRLGPYPGGAQYGTFFEATAIPMTGHGPVILPQGVSGAITP